MSGPANPFVRFRSQLDSYEPVRAGDLPDDRFVELVEQLDRRLIEVDGVGFETTPLLAGPVLADAAGLEADIVAKVEVDNVGNSHKARHLFGTALHLLVHGELGTPLPERLAIASCGNAAVGAAIVARALDRPLDVFVPMWADEGVIDRLAGLGAEINRCERREDEAGDPAYLRFREAVDAGAHPFSVQGTDNPHAFDGGRTLGWELAEQAPDLDAVYVQVGGGALATSTSLGLGSVELRPVQAEGCAPLERAWTRLGPTRDFEAAADEPDRYMEPWIDPSSAATGILDDVTYDWLPLLERTHVTGGRPIVADETTIVRAHELVSSATGLTVSATGTAGFAGLLSDPPSTGQRVAVLLTGKY